MNEVNNEFFVYIDWTTEDVPRPFYVGFGNWDRVKNKRRNKHHTNIKKKYGLNREVFLVQNEIIAKQFEIKLIAEYKTYVYGNDYVFGANYTIGGDGSRGHKQPPLSEERKQYISEINSHPKSVETRQKMSDAMKIRKNDPEWIKKMSECSIERWKNDEYREKMRSSRLGQKRTEEQCKRMSEAQKWDDEKRARAKKSAKKRFLDPLQKELVSNNQKNLWKDPEYRIKQSEAIRNGHAAKRNKNV